MNNNYINTGNMNHSLYKEYESGHSSGVRSSGVRSTGQVHPTGEAGQVRPTGEAGQARSTGDDLFENIDKILINYGLIGHKENLIELFVELNQDQQDLTIENFENFLQKIKIVPKEMRADPYNYLELLKEFPDLEKKYNDYYKSLFEQAMSNTKVKWVDITQPSASERHSKFMSNLFGELEEKKNYKMKMLYGRGGRRKSRKSRKNKTNKRKNYKR